MFDIEEKFIPYTARRYSVTIKGEIYFHKDNKKTKLPIQKIEKENYVEIDWIYGRELYNLGLFILFSFERLNLPEHLLDRVEILYRDGNPDNLILKNIIYRFKNGPIEVENYPDYFYIPFYTSYGIKSNGDLINVDTGKKKVWTVMHPSITKNITNGYYYSRVVTPDGYSKTLFLHRALALTFLPYENNVFDLTVNHKDGNGSNNSLNNLEWATYRENNIHAANLGLRPNSSSPIVMLDTETNKEYSFPTIIACTRYLFGENSDSIENERRNIAKLVSTGNLYMNRYKFKYKNTKQWVDETKRNTKFPIIARNIFSGDLAIYEDVSHCSKELKLQPSVVLRHVREKTNIPYKGFNFRIFNKDVTWPVHTERHLQIYKKYTDFPSNGVIEKNIETGEERLFESISDACQNLRVSRQKLFEIIDSGKPYKNKFYLIFDIEKEYV